MVTSQQCSAKYGNPKRLTGMVKWPVPADLHVGVIPSSIYCNKDITVPLEKALRNVVERKLIGQIKTWDGCFCIRAKRGGTTFSLHSWGIAVDINAASNQFNKTPTMSPELVACFKDAGFDWGGDWHSVKDGMHFQLSKI